MKKNDFFAVVIVYLLRGFLKIVIVLGLTGTCKYAEYEDEPLPLVVWIPRVQSVEQHEQWQCGRLPLGGRGWAVLCEARRIEVE